MKRLLLFIFCFVQLPSNAQNNQLILSPVFAINIRNIGITLFNRRVYYPQKTSYSFGVNASYYFSNNKISTDIAVLYHSLSYRNQASSSFLYGSNNHTNIVFDLAYVKIPVGIKYRLLNKDIFKIDIPLGLSFDFLIESSEKITYCDKCNSFNTYSKQFAFSTYIGLGFKWLLPKDISINIQPTLDFYMNGFDKIKPNRVLVPSIYFGLGYIFSRKEQ